MTAQHLGYEDTPTRKIEEIIMAENISHDARWSEYPAEEWSDALVQSMKLGGIDHLFFVSGSEIAFWQEKRRQGERERLADAEARHRSS